jgi:hypothetical protein
LRRDHITFDEVLRDLVQDYLADGDPKENLIAALKLQLLALTGEEEE